MLEREPKYRAEIRRLQITPSARAPSRELASPKQFLPTPPKATFTAPSKLNRFSFQSRIQPDRANPLFQQCVPERAYGTKPRAQLLRNCIPRVIPLWWGNAAIRKSGA